MGIENLFNKSWSANVMISAFSQSFADLDDAVGKEKAKMILANTNTKIFLKLVDIDTAESVARYGGRKYTIFFFFNIISEFNDERTKKRF